MQTEPVSGQPFGAIDAPPTPWPEARRRIQEAAFYWLATVRPNGRPHVRPVLAVWTDGALHVAFGAATRKGGNLARDSHCVVSAASGGLHLVVEGQAQRVSDEARLHRAAAVYASKYGWRVDVRDDAFHADGAPTAGPPPYQVYEIRPDTAFAFSEDGSVSAMRWSFETRG